MEDQPFVLEGITLSNENLLSTENLQLQLSMILSILAEHEGKLVNVAKKEFEVDKQITIIRADLRTTTEKVDSLWKMHEESQEDRKEQESKASTSIQKIEGNVEILQTEKTDIQNQLAVMEPRLATVESTSATNFERVDATLEEHAASLTASNDEALQQRTKLEHLEDQFEKAHVDTVVAKVEAVETRMETEEQKLVVQEARLAQAEKDQKLLSSSVKELRPYMDRTFSTKKDASVIRQDIKKCVTKDENKEAQESFHAKLNNFVFEEMENQKFDIISKMHRLQERMAKEMEEVSHSTEVQNCVEKVQDLMGAMEDVSSYVASHHQAIERNASRIVELGRGFDNVSVLRGGVTELQEKMEGMLQTMSEKVKENLKKERADKKGFELLGELDGNIQEQIKTLHHHLQHDVVPKPYLEDVMHLMKRRIADLEWKVIKRRSEEAIPFGENADKNREFNKKLFAMHSPLLMAQRAPMNNLPARPQSALARSSHPKPSSRPSSAMDSTHHSALARSSDFVFAAASNQFESLEMRKAFQEGQHPSSKGSAAAVRVYQYKREKEREFGLEIPKELEQLLQETDPSTVADELIFPAESDTATETSVKAPTDSQPPSSAENSAPAEKRQEYDRSKRSVPPRPGSRARPTTAPPKRADMEPESGPLGGRAPVPRPASALHPQPSLDLSREEEVVREIVIEQQSTQSGSRSKIVGVNLEDLVDVDEDEDEDEIVDVEGVEQA